MFQCENLNFNFANRTGNYNFFSKTGEITVILGKNGIGKTTLFKNILGIENNKPNGKIAFDGTNIFDLSSKKRSQIISYLPQKNINLQNITALEYVLTGRTPYLTLLEIPSSIHKEIARKYLDLFGVLKFEDRLVNTLSGGEFAKVSIAKVFAQETKILLLDEPTAPLDYESCFEFMELIKKNGKLQEKVIILTLHDPNLALKYADRFIILGENNVEFNLQKNDEKLIEVLENLYNMKIFTIENNKILLRNNWLFYLERVFAVFRINEYYFATSIEDAYENLTKRRNNAILGGCMWLRQSDKNIGTAIDLSKIPLDYIKEDEQFIYIGAMTTLTQVEYSELLQEYYGDIFKKMTHHIVGTQFRNTATIGGSVYGRYSFSDILTAFLPLKCIVKTAKYGEIPLEQFRDLPYEKDVLEFIKIPKVKVNCAYTSFRNQSTDFPVLAVCVAKHGDKTHISVGARPEKASLVYSKDEALNLRFRDNYRASAEYRKELTKVLIDDVLNEIGGK